MKVQSVPLLALVVTGMISVACSSSSGGPSGSGGSASGGTTGSGGSSSGQGSGGNSSSGGAQGSGGNHGSGGKVGSGGASSGGASGTACTATANVTACGGTVTGTWTASGCLNVSGSLDVRSLFGLTCPAGQVTGSLQVSGTWTANANGTFTDNTMTTGTEQLTLPAECMTLSMSPVTCERLAGVMGSYYDTATCVDASGGGCTCTGTVKQMGTLGVVSTAANTDGNYTTASNTITITQDSTQYAYCVAGGKLTLTPQSNGPAITGTIVLQGDTATGSGGSSGSGGAGGKGGNNSGSGGAAPGGKSGSGGASQTGGMTGTGSGGSGSGTRTDGPCDIYAAANTPCAGAYSMVRSLAKAYAGPLYQVRSGSSSTNTGMGGMTKDIGQTADGYADASVQDAFCMGTVCTVSKLYDQSGNGNDLIRGSAGPTGNGTRSGDDDYESSATKLSITAGGHKVYALYMQQYEGYRTPLNVTGKGMPTGNKAQGIYELVDGTHFGTMCCWDFGAVSPDPSKYVVMNTMFFGTGFWGTGTGKGPWFMGDFEGGVWAGGTGAATVNNPMNPSMAGINFALGVLHTPVGKYALRMADVQMASDLTTAYDGGIPTSKMAWANSSGIALGIGGDNSNNSYGTFYEGALTNGSPSNDTDLLIMKNIKSVGYAK